MKSQITLLHAFVLLLCFIGFDVVHSQLGDRCTLQATSQQGICKKIIECPSALESRKNDRLPETCGSEETKHIVCCPDVSIIDKNSDTKDNVVGVKSREKCEEYSKFAYTYFNSPALVFGGERNQSRLDCPFRVVPWIIGGTKAKPKEFPHSAVVGYDSPEGTRYLCGGSLISENFVLSAGHCQSSKELGIAKYVRVGDLNLVSTTDDAEPQEFDIAEFIRHPDYRSPSNYNDILLIRLAENVKFTHYARPACLYTDHEPTTKTAIATGWGKTETADGSDDLLGVTLEIFGQTECYNLFGRNHRKFKDGIREASQICAGSRSEKKDTCVGDSGGPLQVYHKSVPCSYSLIGVTSFGKICGAVRVPAVYTRVSHYLDWIEKTVWP